MKKVGIVDTLTLTKGDRIYGHFNTTAMQYFNALSKGGEVNNKANCNVVIIGGKTYEHYFDRENLLQLPFTTTKNEFDDISLKARIFRTFKSFINTFVALISDVEILVFQDANQTVLYTLLRFLRVKKQVYLIKYTVEKRRRAIHGFEKVKNKISGIITSLDTVGKFYGVEYIIVPDYFPDVMLYSCKKEYDYAVVGTAMKEKDFEGVVSAFSQSTKSLYIAGYFPDKKRYNNLMKLKTDNVKIINRYLDDNEYDKTIRKSGYIILPYKSGYEEKSSGVILDAVYRGTPVIVSNINSFQFVKEHNIGRMYDSINELACIVEKSKLDQYSKEIIEFINKQKRKEREIIKFILSEKKYV